ncbi:MAG: L-dopachrome tautomerase-related protein [Sphingobacteriaceae bacterium]
MRKNKKHSLEFKLSIVDRIVRGHVSAKTIAKEHSLSHDMVRCWQKRFESFGIEGLKSREGKAVYPQSFKISVLRTIQEENLSLMEAMLRFNLPSPSIIVNWRKQVKEEPLILNNMKYSIIGLILAMMVGVKTNAQETPNLEEFASFGQSQPIGVSVSNSNRVFVSFPRREPYLFGLTEIINGERNAFPNDEWNTGSDAERNFVNVQDLYIDGNDQLWVLDSKPAPSRSIFGDTGDTQSEGQFKLVQIDLIDNTVKNIFTFEDLDKRNSGLNDVRVDTERNLAYLSDPGQAAVIILDLTTGKTRKVLEQTAFTQADEAIVLRYQGRDMVDSGGNPFRSNVNGIALTKDNEWFYFKPINASNLYRISTQFLSNPDLSDSELLEKVEDKGEVGVTHGLIADTQGNIYLTTSLDYSIKRLTPEGRLQTVVKDPRLLWPDSLGIGEDGFLYFSCAQMQLLPQWNGGDDKLQYPFAVYRVKIL